VKIAIVTGLLAAVSAMAFALNTPSDSITFKVYSSPLCSCCDGYENYLRSKGAAVQSVDIDDLAYLKTSLNIPRGMWSCHTSVVGDYFIKGHVPVEAVRKLLDEKPDIRGIALPGMPASSPGMGGVKNQPFTIYSITVDSTIEIYMVL
jgi:hypothetical protein